MSEILITEQNPKIVISKLLAIIKNQDNVVSNSTKDFLIEIVVLIKSLLGTIDELKKQQSIESALGGFDEFENSSENDDVKKIRQVQTYLRNEYKDIYNKLTNDNKSQLKDIIVAYVNSHGIKFFGKSITETATQMTEEILEYGVMTPLMNDTSGEIEEIQIDDFKDVNVMRKGRIVHTDIEFSSADHLKLFVDKLTLDAQKSQKAVPALTEKDPFIRVRVGDSTRVSIMGGGIARRGPGLFPGGVIHVCIRKQKSDPITVDKLLKWGSIDEYGCLLLRLALCHGVSVCAFGGTGSGKTASLRAFFEFLPDDLRVITMAETDEMNLRKVDMEEYLKDSEGNLLYDSYGNLKPNPRYGKAINSVLMWEFPDLTQEIMKGKPGFVGGVNASLTFTPDMIILQESKGGEIKDVIEEAISGHQVCTTIHVNNSATVPLRILLMFQQSGTNISDQLVLKQVPEAFPLLVEFKRLRDGTRKITEISELMGFDAQTFEPRIRPLIKYVIEKTTYDQETGSYKILGKHRAIFNPLKGKIFNIMREHGLTDDDIIKLQESYDNRKMSSTDFDGYKRTYGYDS